MENQVGLNLLDLYIFHKISYVIDTRNRFSVKDFYSFNTSTFIQINTPYPISKIY